MNICVKKAPSVNNANTKFCVNESTKDLCSRPSNIWNKAYMWNQTLVFTIQHREYIFAEFISNQLLLISKRIRQLYRKV